VECARHAKQSKEVQNNSEDSVELEEMTIDERLAFIKAQRLFNELAVPEGTESGTGG